jgi:hypothetical protein
VSNQFLFLKYSLSPSFPVNFCERVVCYNCVFLLLMGELQLRNGCQSCKCIKDFATETILSKFGRLNYRLVYTRKLLHH